MYVKTFYSDLEGNLQENGGYLEFLWLCEELSGGYLEVLWLCEAFI